jgi:hypothetical protein
MRVRNASLLAATLGMSACASAGTLNSEGAATCNADAATTLMGREAPDDATILRRTGGTIVRRIAPGDMTTKDYRIERVTVTVADRRVISALCG